MRSGLNTREFRFRDRCVVNCDGIEVLFIQITRGFRVSLRSLGQIVKARLVLFGVRETWR